MVQHHRHKGQIGFKPHALPGGAPYAHQGSPHNLRAEIGAVPGHWGQGALPEFTLHFQSNDWQVDFI